NGLEQVILDLQITDLALICKSCLLSSCIWRCNDNSMLNLIPILLGTEKILHQHGLVIIISIEFGYSWLNKIRVFCHGRIAERLGKMNETTKFNEKREVEKYKARLVAKGYSQQHASKGWNIFQLDVKSAFLHGELSENVYVDQPLGYQKEGKNKVYKLRKALYGLKQAPRAWYSKIESYFVQEKFEKCHHEHTLFVKQSGQGKILIVSLYVDDLIYTGNDEEMFERFKSSMKNKFAMNDLGKMRYFLGVEVCSPIVPGNKLNKDEGGKPIDARMYRQLIGSLMYFLATRPDLAFSTRGGDCELEGWSNSDYAGDIDDRKSTSGYVFMYATGVVSWSSKKQAIVTLSTTEAEFVAATSCACQGVWLRRILEQLKQVQVNGTVIFCDNTSSIKLSKNPVMHGRCKHIDVRYHD
ncbi:copia-type polyprotein, partial [Trifolium medium]|nr:copia-type polyprotein [Trifolium medium]